MTAQEWIQAFASEIGAEAPGSAQSEQILKLAAVAAHASERTAAPIACYLAGRAGKPLDEAIEAAQGVAESAEG